jgi:hypothetical protein
MKATLVRYERLESSGSYANIKVGVEYTVGEHETAQQVLEQARGFVDDAIAREKARGRQRAIAAAAERTKAKTAAATPDAPAIKGNDDGNTNRPSAG